MVTRVTGTIRGNSRERYYNLGTEAAAAKHNTISSGFVIHCNYYDSEYAQGSAGTFAHTGVTTAGKAGNWPNADGYFYDADGKQFRILDRANVKAFGALGNNSADDTPAFQAAINAAEALGDIHVYIPIPPIKYLISSTLTISIAITMKGESAQNTVIESDGSIGAGSYMLDCTDSGTNNIEGLELQGFTLRDDTATCDLMRLNKFSNVVLRDIFMYEGNHGITFHGNRTFSIRMERVITQAKSSGNVLNFESYTGGGQITCDDCSLSGNRALLVDNASTITGIHFVNCNFEANTSEATLIQGTVYAFGVDHCRFEANNGSRTVMIDPSASDACYGISITNNEFDTVSETYAVEIGGTGGAVQGFRIASNTFRDYGTACVRLNTVGNYGSITENWVNNAIPMVTPAPRDSVFVSRNVGSGGSLDIQTLTGAGAVDLVSNITHVVTTGTDALTLSDGAENQWKTIVMKTDGGAGTLTPSNAGNFTTITFDDVGDSANLIFTNSAWHFMGGTATVA